MSTISISDFPKVLVEEYRNTISCTTQDELKELVPAIAQKVAHLYSRFLTSEYHAERDKKLLFTEYPSEFPSNEEVALFETQLTQRIIQELQPKSLSQAVYVDLSTGYGPEKYLYSVLKECKTSGDTYKYFPLKTCTTLSLNYKTQVLDIKMRARRPVV